MTRCRFVLMNGGVCESDFTDYSIASKPLIGECITMESDSGFKTYEIVAIQHTFKKDGTFKYIIVTGKR